MICGIDVCNHHNLLLLTLAAIIGTIGPSGNEVGLSSIEQAALQTAPDQQRTRVRLLQRGQVIFHGVGSIVRRHAAAACSGQAALPSTAIARS
jgi:hypothetical protein